MGIGIFFDFLLATSVVVWLLRLGLVGALTAEQAGLAIVGLVILMAISRARGMSLTRLTFRVGLPVAGVAALVIWESGGDPGRMIELLALFLQLFIVLAAFYMIAYNLFRRKRGDPRS